MKNLFAFILVLSVVAFTVVFSSNCDFETHTGKVTIVAGLQSEYPAFASVIESGGLSYVSCDITNYSHLKNKLKNIRGMTIKFDNMSYDSFIKNFNVKIIKEEVVDDLQVVYGYSNNWSSHIFIDNKMSNVQIVKAEKLVVGVPAIYDCF